MVFRLFRKSNLNKLLTENQELGKKLPGIIGHDMFSLCRHGLRPQRKQEARRNQAAHRLSQLHRYHMTNGGICQS